MLRERVGTTSKNSYIPVGKIGKISNFGAVGDGSDKGNIGKISNVGAVGHSSDKLVILVP